MHESSWFVTLTYTDEELPQYGSLRAQDFSRFVGDLRKAERTAAKKEGRPTTPISYFGVGEYGEETERPHMHAVLYGAPFLDRYRFYPANRNPVWRAESLDTAWGLGTAEFDTLTMASASYVAGYVLKKQSKTKAPDHYMRVDEDTGEVVELEQEFSRMSLRPAIGSRWIEEYWTDVYSPTKDYVVVDGVKAKPPRYYDKWMDKHHPFVMDDVRQRRYDEAVELTKEKLAAKATIHSARNALYARRDTM